MNQLVGSLKFDLMNSGGSTFHFYNIRVKSSDKNSWRLRGPEN